MKKEVTEKYREKIDTQLKEKETEIENSMTFISVGSLGFFLTINEKFFKLDNTNFIYLLYISLSLILLSFIILLLKKYKTTEYDRRIIDHLDNFPEGDKINDQVLLGLWKKFESRLKCLKILSYSTLGLGITLQTMFFFSNLHYKKDDSKEAQKIEIIINHKECADTLILDLKNDTINKIYILK